MIQKIIKEFFNKYFFILFGALIFVTYIWLRFIRERLPKELPFNLSFLGFLILIELCIIYLYIIISCLDISKKNTTRVYIINLLYKPLEEFDYFWKHLSFIQTHYIKFSVWLAYKLQYVINKNNIFYIIFAILPRIILITIFYIDIFYFQKLEYIYNFLFFSTRLLI